MYKTNEDKYYISKTEMEEKLIALLGGRAAEKIALNDISTGASNDIEVATNIARDMITVYGMSDNLGPIYIKQKDPYENNGLGENIDDVVGAEVKRINNFKDVFKNYKIVIFKHVLNNYYESKNIILLRISSIFLEQCIIETILILSVTVYIILCFL